MPEFKCTTDDIGLMVGTPEGNQQVISLTELLSNFMARITTLESAVNANSTGGAQEESKKRHPSSQSVDENRSKVQYVQRMMESIEGHVVHDVLTEDESIYIKYSLDQVIETLEYILEQLETL